MPVLDNSPSSKRIRWCDIQVIYKGEIFNIKDGYTDKRYVYWDLRNPNIFLSSDNLPYEYIEIVFINNDGVHTMYPSLQISVVDTVSSKLKYEQMDKSVESLREFTTLLDVRLKSIEKQVVSIRDMMINIDNRLKVLEK